MARNPSSPDSQQISTIVNQQDNRGGVSSSTIGSQQDPLVGFSAIRSDNWYQAYPWFDELPDEYKNQIINNPWRLTYREPSTWETMFPKKWQQEMSQNLAALRDHDNKVYQAYLQFKNSLPETQVQQQIAAGINPNMQSFGASSAAPASDSIAGGAASGLNQDDPVTQVTGFIGSMVSIFSSVVGTVKDFAEVASIMKNNKVTDMLPDKTAAEILSILAGTRNTDAGTDQILAGMPGIEADNLGKMLANMAERQRMLENVRNVISKGFDAGEFVLGEDGTYNLPSFGSQVMDEYAQKYVQQYASSVAGRTGRLGSVRKLGTAIAETPYTDPDSPEFADYYNMLAEIQGIALQYRYNLEMVRERAGLSKEMFEEQFNDYLLQNGGAETLGQAELAGAKAETAESDYNADYFTNMDGEKVAGYEMYAKDIENRLDQYHEQFIDEIVPTFNKIWDRATRQKDPYSARICAELLRTMFSPEAFGSTQTYGEFDTALGRLLSGFSHKTRLIFSRGQGFKKFKTGTEVLKKRSE